MSTEMMVAGPSRAIVTDRACGRVLIADDDAISRRILQSWMEGWGYQVVMAEDGDRAWSILQQEPAPELLILDWEMPGIDGIELCRRIRERPRVAYQYIFLATGKNAKEDMVQGLEAGADDYLTKPFDQNELRARLQTGRRILTLQENLIRAGDELRFQATHDTLTGIWNRGAVLDFLHRECARAARTQSPTAILMLDLDHFKMINDTHGHLAGDDVLREVAARISRQVRTYDVVGRYGGEEFLIVLPGCPRNEIEASADRIRTAIGNKPIVTASAELLVTASIGAALLPADGAASEDQILLEVDQALYLAKNNGRNRVWLA